VHACASKRPCAFEVGAVQGRGALSGAHSGLMPRELAFQGGVPIAKGSVRGFLIAQSLGEVEGNDHEKPDCAYQHAFAPRYLPWAMAVRKA
jgi:hypothetical protein